MRRMSFMLTKRQIQQREKTVTRRLGWANLKPGQRFLGVEKAMGLKAGEKQVVLAELECVSNRAEPLSAMNDDDCAREGFPEMNAAEFVAMFMKHMKCTPETPVQRIEFKYVESSK